MKRINKLTLFNLFICCLFLISCQDSCNTDISKVANKIPIEIRVVGVLQEDEAQKEIISLLKGINFDDGYRVPILNVNDITYNTDSTKRNLCTIKIPLAKSDAAALEISGYVLDQATYQTNLDDAIENDFKNDTLFSKGLSILIGKRGNSILRSKLPNDPPNSNEFYVSTSNLVKSEPEKHIFKSSEELILHIEQSKLKMNNLIVYYMGGKSPASLKDTDKDGVTDDIDTCKEIFGQKECSGCPCELSKQQVPNIRQSLNQNQTPGPPPNNCGSCKQKFNVQINSANNSVSWNSCPSARFIYVEVTSSSGKFQKSYQLNGSTTNFTIPLSSEAVIKNNPSIPLHDKFAITVKAECGSGKIIQSESKSKIKLKCS